MWKYCDTISSLFFSLFFYPPHTYRISFSFFSFFLLLHTRTLTLFFFYFFPLFIPTTSSKLHNVPTLLLPFFFLFSFLSLSTSSTTPMQFFTLIFLILFFFSKFNHLQTGWFRSGRLDQSKANVDGYKLHLKDFAIF